MPRDCIRGMADFVLTFGMWAVMMVAMMTPSAAPMSRRLPAAHLHSLSDSNGGRQVSWASQDASVATNLVEDIQGAE